jgi:hypothetical protein
MDRSWGTGWREENLGLGNGRRITEEELDGGFRRRILLMVAVARSQASPEGLKGLKE